MNNQKGKRSVMGGWRRNSPEWIIESLVEWIVGG